MRVLVLMMLGFSLCALSACEKLERLPASPQAPEELIPTLFYGGGVGESCDDDQPCRSGLTCVSDLCEPSGDRALNEPCILTSECADDLICGWAGFCSEAGERQLSEPCAHDGDCARGYFCDRTGGIAGECVAQEGGGADVGASCDDEVTCAPGLICSPDRPEPVCLPGSLLLNPDIFRGVACDSSGEAEMPFGMRHALPNAGADFFATPFPTDLRISSGRLDLRDYPRPGAGLNESDLFGTLLGEISHLRSGWSRNPGIYLRFTRALSSSYLPESERMEAGSPARSLSDDIKLIDLDTGREWPIDIRFHAERNKYICAHHVFVHPKWSNPLTPGHHYAVVVYNSLRSVEDESPRPLDATERLLGKSAPREPIEREAWQRYAPLRLWIEENPVEGAKLVGATVFTVEPDQELMRQARDAVYDQAQVRFDPQHEPVVCAPEVRSPCASTEEELNTLAERGHEGPDPRGCPAEPHPLYHEIHARVLLPLFQQGEPPYTRTGGEVITDEGRPRFRKFTSVCMSITVPRDLEPPETGWPVVLYGHGTGGNFRAGVKLLGGLLSSMRADPSEEAPDTPGELQPAILIAIDQVMHGTRLGADTLLAPGPLFFNVQNPIAARGNLIQGALDNFALARFVAQDSDLHTWEFPEIGQLKVNREHIAYHGHSQGGTTGPLFAPFAEELNGVVFSGTAGGIMFSLVDKKEPYDATLGLQLALQEFNLDEDHPALHVFQEYFDDVDPINYAEKLFLKPAGNPLHMLHIYGLRDTFTPDSGQRSYAAASGATLAISQTDITGFDLLTDLDINTQSYPISKNYQVGSVGLMTAVVAQHAPENPGANGEDGEVYNGHFVAYKNPTARSQLMRFLRDLSQGEIPQVREE